MNGNLLSLLFLALCFTTFLTSCGSADTTSEVTSPEVKTEVVKEEEKKLSDRRKVKENKAKGVKKFLSDYLQLEDLKKFETARIKLSFRKSESVNITVAAEKLPAEYYKEKTEYTADKIEIKKEESLNAIFGKYVKFIVANEKIESQMTERILKYSIHVIEAFNDIRNNRSFAHDNQILNYSESVLIFNNVTNSIKFIETIEKTIEEESKKEKTETVDWEDLPF